MNSWLGGGHQLRIYTKLRVKVRDLDLKELTVLTGLPEKVILKLPMSEGKTGTFENTDSYISLREGKETQDRLYGQTSEGP